MSFSPLPEVHLYHMSASSIEGFLRTSATLVAASIPGGAAQHGAYVYALEGLRQKADSGKFARAAPDPIPHREKFKESPFLGVIVELAARPRGDDRVAGKVEPRLFPPRLRLYHGVARLGGSARLGGDYRERPAKLSVELVEHEVVSVGVGVVEKEHFHLVRFRRAQSLRNELGAERGTAYAYAKDIFKFPVRARDFAAVDLFGKTLYLGDVALNLRLDFGSGRELRQRGANSGRPFCFRRDWRWRRLRARP